jgi:hypothetical protein
MHVRLVPVLDGFSLPRFYQWWFLPFFKRKVGDSTWKRSVKVRAHLFLFEQAGLAFQPHLSDIAATGMLSACPARFHGTLHLVGDSTGGPF